MILQFSSGFGANGPEVSHDEFSKQLDTLMQQRCDEFSQLLDFIRRGGKIEIHHNVENDTVGDRKIFPDLSNRIGKRLQERYVDPEYWLESLKKDNDKITDLVAKHLNKNNVKGDILINHRAEFQR